MEIGLNTFSLREISNQFGSKITKRSVPFRCFGIANCSLCSLNHWDCISEIILISYNQNVYFNDTRQSSELRLTPTFRLFSVCRHSEMRLSRTNIKLFGLFKNQITFIRNCYSNGLSRSRFYTSKL